MGSGTAHGWRCVVTAPKPNAELAYRVLDHIDAHPETWSQGTWDCGTAACFAGWAVRLSGGKVDPLSINNPDPIVAEGPEQIVGLAVPDAAEIVLQSDCRDADGLDLFDAANTREDLGRLVAEIFGPRPGGEPREMQPPPCSDHETSELSCPVCTAQRRAFYAALGRDDPNDCPCPCADGPERAS